MSAWTGWEQQLLSALGAPASPGNLRLLAAWQRAEGGSASFNPLNTTQPASGASNYNSVGVKNYPSVAVGLRATVQTLTNGRYGGIVSDLRKGNVAPAVIASRNAGEFNTWGTGSGNILAVLGASRTLRPSGGSTQPTRTRPGAAGGSTSGGGGGDNLLSDVFGSLGSPLSQLTTGLFGSITGPVEFYKFVMAILSPRMWLRAVELAIGSLMLLIGLVLLALDTGGTLAAAAPRPARKLARRTLAGAGLGVAASAARGGSKPKANARARLSTAEREQHRRSGQRQGEAAAIRKAARRRGERQEATRSAIASQRKQTREQTELRRFRRTSAMGR